jgi:hypothetical protein
LFVFAHALGGARFEQITHFWNEFVGFCEFAVDSHAGVQLAPFSEERLLERPPNGAAE